MIPMGEVRANSPSGAKWRVNWSWPWLDLGKDLGDGSTSRRDDGRWMPKDTWGGARGEQCSPRGACGGHGRGGPGHTYLSSFYSTGHAGQMVGHRHRAFGRIPPHSFSSRLDGCLSSQLGHRTLKSERRCLSSHQCQCGNPPAFVDSCWWAKHMACWTGLFLVWESTLDPHTPSLPAPPSWKASLPGDAVILVPGGLFQLTLPRVAGWPGPWPKIQVEQQSLAWACIFWMFYVPW